MSDNPKLELTKPSATSTFAQEHIIPLLNALALLRKREKEKLKNTNVRKARK